MSELDWMTVKGFKSIASIEKLKLGAINVLMPTTAPSKRVELLVKGYQKPLFGNAAILEIGLGPIRSACPHFDSWMRRLES